jgi:hypothetical protein
LGPCPRKGQFLAGCVGLTRHDDKHDPYQPERGPSIVATSLGVPGDLGLVVAFGVRQGQPLPSRTVATSSEPWGRGRRTPDTVMGKSRGGNHLMGLLPAFISE